MSEAKRKYVLDTSIFVNPAVRSVFGKSPVAALAAVLDVAGQIPDEVLWMPKAIFAELRKHLGEDYEEICDLEVLNRKTPNRYELKVPALFFYDLVSETRGRVDRGMRLGERCLQDIAGGRELPESIRNFRVSYRKMMRENFLDSRNDLDVLLLAYELRARLVTADEGLIAWAEKLGILCEDVSIFYKWLRQQTESDVS